MLEFLLEVFVDALGFFLWSGEDREWSVLKICITIAVVIVLIAAAYWFWA